MTELEDVAPAPDAPPSLQALPEPTSFLIQKMKQVAGAILIVVSIALALYSSAQMIGRASPLLSNASPVLQLIISHKLASFGYNLFLGKETKAPPMQVGVNLGLPGGGALCINI
jgi:hypothetical protein